MEWLVKLADYFEAIRRRAEDAAAKGEELCRALKEYLASLALDIRPIMAAGPDEKKRVSELAKECKALLKDARPKGKKSVAGAETQAIGPGALLLLQIILAILEALKKKSA